MNVRMSLIEHLDLMTGKHLVPNDLGTTTESIKSYPVTLISSFLCTVTFHRRASCRVLIRVDCFQTEKHIFIFKIKLNHSFPDNVVTQSLVPLSVASHRHDREVQRMMFRKC